MTDIFDRFVEGVKDTSLLEFIGVVAGIASVLFSRQESIWVFPTGLINTIIFIYLSVHAQLFGEASVNFYYTIMSIYGWMLWARRDQYKKPVWHIAFSTRQQLMGQCLFFLVFYLCLYAALTWLKNNFAPEAVPWADAFASATAYTGMWLMARKKVESWYWWMATNLASIPLYFTKGFVFTSFQFFVLLILAVLGLESWKKKARMQKQVSVDATNFQRIRTN